MNLDISCVSSLGLYKVKSKGRNWAICVCWEEWGINNEELWCVHTAIPLFFYMHESVECMVLWILDTFEIFPLAHLNETQVGLISHSSAINNGWMCAKKKAKDAKRVSLLLYPGIDWSGAYYFYPICLFVCLWLTLTSTITFEQKKIDFIFSMHASLKMSFQMRPMYMTLWNWLWPGC